MLAPFVGAGTFAGYSERQVPQPYQRPGDEPDTRISGVVMSIYPETGVHFWWNPYVRLTTSARYVISTSGRGADDWLIGGGLAIFKP